MDDGHKNGLYRWQRQTKPIVQSRAHRVSTSNDIQDWIEKVENAATKATDVAFGLAPTGKSKGKALAQAHTKHARAEEEAHSEAQELLRQWVSEKVHFDEDDGFDDLEAWRRARQQQNDKKTDSSGHSKKNNGSDFDDVESAADILNNIRYEDDWEIDEAAIYERVKKSALGEEDPYAHLYDMDENEAVSSVLNTLMSKDVVKQAFKKDLGIGENCKHVPDPRTKMELRHQMVKENREKRQKEETKKMMNRQLKKDARLQAQQMIMKETKEKEFKVKREEDEIKKEMTRLRKELAWENKKKEENIRRDREEKEEMGRLAREELERQKFEEDRMQMECRRMESDKRKNQMIKQELWRTKQESKNLKCLHLHFTAWYELVLSRRLLLGKVKAMSDWKVTVRVWGAWKSYVRGQRAQVASVQHEKAIIESHRKTLAAETHYRHHLLWKCMNAWRYFVKEEIDRREMEEEKEVTKNKMMSLLNAVAEGRMVKENSTSNTSGLDTTRSKSSTGGCSRVSNPTQNQKHIGSNQHVQAWVDADDAESQFSDLTSLTNNSRPHSAMTSEMSSFRPHSAMTSEISSRPSSVMTNRGKKRVPTEAWQVTKQHTQLDAEEIRNLGQGQGDEQEGNPQNFTDAQIRKRFGTQPWMNRHYVVNNFEHRYNAQQRALKQQQEEIKEQKRQIEELQYKQHQQLLRQQLSTGVASPALPVEVEAPPKGKEIPRGEEGIPPGLSNPTSQKEITKKGEESKGSKQTHGKTKPLATPNSTAGHNASDHQAHHSDGLTSDRTGMTTQRTISDVSKVSSASQNTKYLQVLKNMEDRSAQRAKQKAERDERRRMQEEEKLAELERQEMEQLKQIEEEKKARVEAFKQKKRLEKQKEEERQREAARQQEQLDRAKAHYDRSVLKYRGLLPLKKLISLSKRNWNRAVRHHNHLLLKQNLRDWKDFTRSEIQRKNELADQMGQFLLTKHCFDRWRKHKHHTEFLLRRAERHFESSLRSKIFYAWVEWKGQEKEEMASKMEQAEQYYWHHLLRSRFLAWRFLPEKQKREEERKKRKMEMRQRVAELIPDFAPHRSVEQSVEVSQDFR